MEPTNRAVDHTLFHDEHETITLKPPVTSILDGAQDTDASQLMTQTGSSTTMRAPYEGVAYIGRSKTELPFIVRGASGIYSVIEMSNGESRTVINAGSASSNGLGCAPKRSRYDDLMRPNPAISSSSSFAETEPLQRVMEAVELAQDEARAMGLPLFSHTSLAVHPWTLSLSDHLRALSPRCLGKAAVTLQLSGTDAVLAAVDAAQQYAKALGRGNKILVGHNSYHGSPDIGFGANPKIDKRAGALPNLQVLYPTYDPLFEGQGLSQTEYLNQLERQLKSAIAAEGPNNIAAILIEPVAGSGRVAQPAPDAYLQMLASVAKAHDIMVISDEVMCGLGRIGGTSLWACEKFGFDADLIVIGKSLGGGLYPISATLVGEQVHQGILNSTRAYIHSHTYSGFPLGCAAAKQALTEFEMIAKASSSDQLGSQLLEMLKERLHENPHLTLHGAGLMLGGYFLKSATTATRFSPETEAIALAQLKQLGMEHGVYVYGVMTAMGPGFMCLPPLTITSSEIQVLGERLTNTLSDLIQILLEKERSIITPHQGVACTQNDRDR